MGRQRQGNPVWVGVCVVVLFFTGVTLAISWWGDDTPGDARTIAADGVVCAVSRPSVDAPETRRRSAGRLCRLQRPVGANAAAGGMSAGGAVGAAAQ